MTWAGQPGPAQHALSTGGGAKALSEGWSRAGAVAPCLGPAAREPTMLLEGGVTWAGARGIATCRGSWAPFFVRDTLE